MKSVRKRLTYANVISSLALFLVLAGGTAFAASNLGKNTVGSKQLKANAVTAAKIKNGAVTGSKLNLSTLGAVPTATNSTNATNALNAVNATKAITATNATHATTADNATTVAGHNFGFVHVVFTGGPTAPSVDAANSSAGVSVTYSGVAGTTCVTAPFPVHAATGSADFLTDPGNVEVLEASPVNDPESHRCPQGTIEVNTQAATGANSGAGTPVSVAYYLFFS